MSKLNNIGLSTHPCFNPKKLSIGSIYPFPILTQYLIEKYKDFKSLRKSPPHLHQFKFEEEAISVNGVIRLSKINKRYK